MARKSERLPFAGKKALYNVLKVRFPNNVRAVECNAGDLMLDAGDRVLVKSKKGTVIGVVAGCRYRKVLPTDVLQPIMRTATRRDIERHEENRTFAVDAVVSAVRHSRDLSLDMKIVTADMMLDRRKVVIYFSADGRIDFRELVKRIAGDMKMRIEMHQIGVRQGAGMLGGIGSCGRELCCSTFLTDFEPVGIRMVKDQGLTLNPKKVAGMCGRLMCCLVYEHSGYVRGRKRMPRRRQPAMTRMGKGRIHNIDIVQELVSVLHDDGVLETFPLIEVLLDFDPNMKPVRRPQKRKVAFNVDGPLGDGAEAFQTSEEQPRKRRRRRRSSSGDKQRDGGRPPEDAAAGSAKPGAANEGGEKPKRRRRRRKPSSDKPRTDGKPTENGKSGGGQTKDNKPARAKSSSGSDNPDKPKRRRRRRRKPSENKPEGGE